MNSMLQCEPVKGLFSYPILASKTVFCATPRRSFLPVLPGLRICRRIRHHHSPSTTTKGVAHSATNHLTVFRRQTTDIMLPAEEEFDGGSAAAAAALVLVRALSSGYGAEGTMHRSDSSMSTAALLAGIILIGLAFCCCFFM